MKPIDHQNNSEAPPRSASSIAHLWSRDTLGAALAAALLVAVYLLLEWLSFIHEHKGLPVTPWNPGLGVMFAVMVMGRFYAPLALIVGVVLAEAFVLRSDLEWPVILAISLIIACSYAAVARFARLRLRLDVGLHRLSDIVVLLLSGTAGAVITAILLTVLLMAVGHFEVRDILPASVPLLVGDVIGVGVMTPLLLRGALAWRNTNLQHALRLAPEVAVFAVVITLVLWLILAVEPVNEYQFFYILFLPVVVAAIRHGLDGACLTLAATQLGLVGLLHRFGYDANAFIAFQTLMLALTATGLIVGVVVSERQAADDAFHAAAAKLKEREAEATQAARFNLVSGMASALAHEINQPMTAARALARSAQQLLRASEPDLARADANLTTMIAQVDHAAGIVRRMRDFLRRGQPHFSTIEVPDLLDDALALARSEATARKVDIELVCEAGLPPIHGDRIQLQQVVLNLIRNAIDAIVSTGQSDGRIRVGAKLLPESAGLEISVSDNGPGIRPDLVQQVFDPLTTSKEEGLGLGLSISASIIEAHGGRIWLHAHAPGATEFRFVLPLEQSGFIS